VLVAVGVVEKIRLLERCDAVEVEVEEVAP
jgi:hypothetical protein